MLPSHFIARFGIFFLLLAMLVAAINIVVDPYLLFDAPRIAGLTDRKPAAQTNDRKMKQYDAVRRPARTLVLGSSRIEIGFNPQSRAWHAEDKPVYNLGLAGSDAGTDAQYMRHVIASEVPGGLPHTLIIGLDFESFLFPPTSAELQNESLSDQSPNSLKVIANGQPNPHRTLQTIKDYAASTLSLDAFMASLSTIFYSNRGTGTTLDERGWMNESVFDEASRANGVAALFQQKNVETVNQYGSSHLALREAKDGSLYDLRAITELISIGNAINAKVILFVQPAHADRWEIFDRLGYWDDIENWKSELVELVDAEQSSGANVELWDFASYQPYVQESLPSDNDLDTNLSWFWEPAHYRMALGDIMIAKMRDMNSPVQFGMKLTRDNLSDWLQKIRADRDQYRDANPAEVARIATVLCNAGHCAP
jgi:hypothetical protein